MLQNNIVNVHICAQLLSSLDPMLGIYAILK